MLSWTLYQDLEHLQRLGKPGKYSVFLQVLVYPTCEGLGLLCPSSLQSISSQVQLVWSSAATNSKQPAHIWVCLLLFLCPLLKLGYSQSPWYRKHLQHIWVLAGSKPFRSNVTVCWPPRAVSAAAAWWQQCQTMSCPAYGKAQPAANVRASPQLWKQGSVRLKTDLQTESSVPPVSQDNL